MTQQVHVRMKDGKPVAVYSDATKAPAGSYVAVELDPPTEESYRVKFSLRDDKLHWEASAKPNEGHELGKRYWGSGYFVWYVVALTPDKAIEIAKELFREMI